MQDPPTPTADAETIVPQLPQPGRFDRQVQSQILVDQVRQYDAIASHCAEQASLITLIPWPPRPGSS